MKEIKRVPVFLKHSVRWVNCVLQFTAIQCSLSIRSVMIILGNY